MRFARHSRRRGDIFAVLEVSGVMRSTDGGESWSDCSADLLRLAEAEPRLRSKLVRPILTLSSLPFADLAPRVFPVGVIGGDALYACLSVAASSKDGVLMSVGLHHGDAKQVYVAARYGEVFGTQDVGESWLEMPLPQGVQHVYALACG